MLPLGAVPTGESGIPEKDITLVRRQIAPSGFFADENRSREITLAELRDRIVVLDFFAPWCAPCVEASRAMHELRQIYEANGGNPAGIPVEILAINVDSSSPERTSAFAKRAGLGTIHEDEAGRLFNALGGRALPFLVVLGPEETADQDDRILFAATGFDGTTEMRAAIDGVGNPAELEKASGNVPVIRTTADYSVEVAGEALVSRDLSIVDAAFHLSRSTSRWEQDFTFAQSYNRIEYRPPDTPWSWEQPEVRKETMDGLRFRVGRTGGAIMAPYMKAGVYKGYTDHRSIWIDEYYRQNFESDAAYKQADPWGGSVSLGLRWEYSPSTAFLEGSITYQFDEVTPGYFPELRSPLRRGEDELETWGFRLSSENAWSPRFRTLQEISLIETTGREQRFACAGSFNYALGEKWTIRATLDGATEKPDFVAGSVGCFLEHELREDLLAGAGLRWYEDSGELEDKAIISSAAPALKTLRAEGGVKWIDKQMLIRLNAGVYLTHYEETGTGSEEFFHLYDDRNWAIVDLAIAWRF
jgi:thiol-disulfide isomerase/thioredoxin